MTTKPTILLVDDEPHLLDGLRRQHRTKFQFQTAVGPAEGLRALHTSGPFAVVVSDMRMPEMNGVEFLKEVKVLSPLSVRLMLTGNSDQETAALAVNEGSIFRFLSKPCEAGEFVQAMNDALGQYELARKEREILESTLTGSIRIVTELLASISPALFAEGVRARELAKQLAERAALEDVWELELAAMFANVGMMSIPAETLERYRRRERLEESERKAIARASVTSGRLLSNIPRLSRVSQMVAGMTVPESPDARNESPVGSRVLQIVYDFLGFGGGTVPARALKELQKGRANYDSSLLADFFALHGVDEPGSAAAVRKEGIEIQPSEFLPGQRILSDILTTDGILLLRAGNTLSEGSVERLHNYARLIGIQGPILVDSRVPTTSTPPTTETPYEAASPAR